MSSTMVWLAIEGRDKVKGLRLPWGHLSLPTSQLFWRSWGSRVGIWGHPLGVLRIYEGNKTRLTWKQSRGFMVKPR